MAHSSLMDYLAQVIIARKTIPPLHLLLMGTYFNHAKYQGVFPNPGHHLVSLYSQNLICGTGVGMNFQSYQCNFSNYDLKLFFACH